MSDERHLLGIRLQMEALISHRESMKALNEFRAMRGEGQAYGDDDFYQNAQAFDVLRASL